MPRIFVPKQHQSSIRGLLQLDLKQFESLVLALKNSREVKGDRLHLSNTPVVGVQKEESGKILETVEMLYRIWSSRGNQSLDGFIGDLADAIGDFYPDGDSSEAKARLRSVLDIEPLARASKALTVSTTQHHLFYDAKVLSDIRFVFRPDPEVEPYGATIVHTLEIVYHEDQDHKSFFVALDGPDLSSIKEVIERAEKKTKQLRKHLASVSVPFLGRNGQ